MSATPTGDTLPRWASIGVLPLINLAVAFFISGLVIVAVGENPFTALTALAWGAVGTHEAIGYTLYYTTNFVFTGLAVAIAFHAGLFNIGGEGQAYIGGLGVALLCLAAGDLPFVAVLPLAIAAAALFGAGWAFVPAWLQAKRGSHIVITTIMFNFIATALMTYLLVNVMIKPGQQSPETREFAPHTWLPFIHDILAAIGVEVSRSPLNLSFAWALLCCAMFQIYVWRTRWGYALRTLGANETAAVYAGIRPARTIIVAMSLSGALAGFVALNEIMGVHHRLLLNFTSGYGFVGIAVALMGRNHPVGVFLAALLFGALYQGGAELAFEVPTLTREMVVVIQGLVIVLCGALENMFKPTLARLFRRQPSLATASAG
ncbi:MAG TPA: ABC transporter permease [Alphaproteobacteria bacterium]|nr:ABC transporter permease [Alphaproteobacteria bacterium]